VPKPLQLTHSVRTTSPRHREAIAVTIKFLSSCLSVCLLVFTPLPKLPVCREPTKALDKHLVLLERELLVLGAILGDDVDVDKVARVDVPLAC
jgi:hypothetical protein